VYHKTPEELAQMQRKTQTITPGPKKEEEKKNDEEEVQ
jgi:hypothetical protein